MYAWGGAKMEAAGAVIVERTGQNAVMGVPGLGKIIEHYQINRRIGRWLREGPLSKMDRSRGVLLHVPVDSPAANFPICKLTRARGYKVVHLVAPQVWAWASWRIRRLKRLSNLVLCLLPFEEEWFMVRGVQAKFVGHPLFDEPLDMVEVNRRAARLHDHGGEGSPKIALMPGSRPAEMMRCFPALLDAFARVRKDFPDACGVVAATSPQSAQTLRAIASEHGGWPSGLQVVAGDTDAAVAWCDFALVVSGTVTLQIARQLKPMVAIYRPSKVIYYLIMKWLVSTRYFTLPNLIAGQRVITEFIPHWGDGEDLAVEVLKFVRREGYAQTQREGLQAVIGKFSGKNAAVESADAIERMLGITPAPRGLGGTHEGVSVSSA